jgi:hypothetical protein
MKGSRYIYMQKKREEKEGSTVRRTIKTYELRRWKKGTQGSIIEGDDGRNLRLYS